ncbi:Uncharacterized protein PBTT_00734 [Plasmodiophora brassicae]|uniref:Uncharacterized protein n=2 Tax=Plasmodiophora brassicae TaxID=37360 RepID=A0A3P3XYZ4_PLABS|nr:unnamed protein product [Plasmodiophora brassicae]
MTSSGRVNVVTIAVSVIICLATNKRHVRGWPVDNREHICEAVMHLEDARASLCEAERIVLDVGREFGGNLLHFSLPSDSHDTTRDPDRPPVSHDSSMPNFEAVFSLFERRIVTDIVALMEAVANAYHWVQVVASQNWTETMLPIARAQTRRFYRDTLTDLASVIRCWAPEITDRCRRPNIFAIRDASYVELPVQRFWDLTSVPINDLTRAILQTIKQVAASRSMLDLLNIDRVSLHDVYHSALTLSATRCRLMQSMVESARTQMGIPELTIIERVFSTLRDHTRRLMLLHRHTEYMASMYRAAFEHLDRADGHIAHSLRLVRLHPLLSDQTARAA